MGWEETSQKILVVIFIVAIGITIVMPPVWADETSIKVTFDPEAAVNIDVSPKTYNFTTIQAGAWKNTTGSYFTLYNNGTVTMDTQFKSNATTDSAQLSLDGDGNPGSNAYSFRTSGLDADGYIDVGYGSDLDSAIVASGTKGFALCLRMGSSLTQNFSYQRTTIYIQGSVSN
jgi:hypothetical protein